MRTLGIDLGARRVGVALSDEGGGFATPFEVVDVTSEEGAVAAVAAIVREQGVKRVVVGLPLNMDDSVGPAARRAVEWGRRLAGVAKVPVLYVDERLSSFEAEQQLSARKRAGEKLTRQRKKEQLDALAAASFLQAFLDGRISAIEVTGAT